MSKGFVALLVCIITMLAATPSISASQNPSQPSTTYPPNDLQTKVVQDGEGNVHVLWLVPALNNSASGPGIWYSKYTPNGTYSIAPMQITNSSNIQSADLTVDQNGNAIIAWADQMTTTYSGMYLLRFNSTQPETSQVLSIHNSLILWPSLAMNNNSVYLTWTVYNPTNSHALVEYGVFTSGKLNQTSVLATYERVDAFPPQARIVFDNSSQHVQIAWGESGIDGQSSSTVNYAKLGSNGTVLTQIQVAKFAAKLRDVSITSMAGHDGAFVVWQTNASDYSLYVSQISANGHLAYVKELNYTSGQPKYLAVSTDLENNFYVVWYQPSTLSAPGTSSGTAASTNVTYVRMNLDGDIIQTGMGVFQAPVIGVTVLSNGLVYGVSPEGLVNVATPTEEQNGVLPMAVVAIMSCVSLAGFAGSILVEEGRYRWAALYSKISRTASTESRSDNQEIFKVLARRPGLKVGELKRLVRGRPVGIITLLRMEKNGLIASFRDGFSRKFYVNGTETCQDVLRTRILLWVLDHPGIWEAQLAKDLGLSQQIVHYHLKKLRETKLITTTVDENGSRKLYRFTDSSHRNSGPMKRL